VRRCWPPRRSWSSVTGDGLPSAEWSDRGAW
jgi:hypothetical protein